MIQIKINLEQTKVSIDEAVTLKDALALALVIEDYKATNISLSEVIKVSEDESNVRLIATFPIDK